jgi:hypothetical protein
MLKANELASVSFSYQVVAASSIGLPRLAERATNKPWWSPVHPDYPHLLREKSMPQNSNGPKTLKFRCPAELEGKIPPPIPATLGVPDWLKAMPMQAFNSINAREEDTIKRCPPFVDAMTSGFLIPLICDLRIQDGEITWDNDIPPGGVLDFPKSPIGFHDASQVSGSPLFKPDRYVIKFHNLWTIEAPEGYSVLFTHPVNRFDLPFTTLSGLVDCDHYRDSWIHFPAHWHDVNFNGVLPKGTPVAQCVPVKRDTWAADTSSLTAEETKCVHELTKQINREPGLYRRLFRA